MSCKRKDSDLSLDSFKVQKAGLWQSNRHSNLLYAYRIQKAQTACPSPFLRPIFWGIGRDWKRVDLTSCQSPNSKANESNGFRCPSPQGYRPVTVMSVLCPRWDRSVSDRLLNRILSVCLPLSPFYLWRKYWCPFAESPGQMHRDTRSA